MIVINLTYIKSKHQNYRFWTKDFGNCKGSVDHRGLKQPSIIFDESFYRWFENGHLIFENKTGIYDRDCEIIWRGK